MPVNLQAPDPQSLFPVHGVALGITMAGIRKANRRDLTVVTIAEGATVAGVFTANRFCAAPVQLCRSHLAGSAQPAGDRRQHRQRQRRHRRRRPGARAGHLRGAGRVI